MDLIITVEGTTSASTPKKEELIDIKYEDHYDPDPTLAIPNEDQVSFILKFRLILHEHLMWILCIIVVVTCYNIKMLFRLINSLSHLFTYIATFILYYYYNNTGEIN